MAIALQLREFERMLERIGFGRPAIAVMTDPNKENIRIDDLRLFSDDGVRTLCQSLRKPGGTIQVVQPAGVLPPPPPAPPVQPPPARGRRGRAPNPPAAVVVPQPAVQNVPDPGVYVSARAELNLTIACYIARHYYRTNRLLEADDITMARVERYQRFKQAEEEHKDPDELLSLLKVERIQEFIDDFPEHLDKYNGQDGKPLSYVIRDEPLVPDEDTDPPFGEPGTEYSSLRDEIKARATLGGDQYPVDNAKVFDLLNSAIAMHTHVKAWIKDFQRRKDGRSAWFAFRSHYRGQSELETIQVQAENRLDRCEYRGEKPRYDFEKHVSNHRRSHNEILKASGVPLQESAKVRKLLTSIHAPELKAAKATVAAMETLRNNFDECVNYFKGQIVRGEVTDERNVSATKVASLPSWKKRKDGNNQSQKQSKKGKHKEDENSDSGKKLDRWYSGPEFRKLSKKQKAAVYAAREERKAAQVTTDETVATSSSTLTSSSTSQRQASNAKLKKDI